MKMIQVLKCALTSVAFLVTTSIAAADQQISVKLDKIEKIKAQEEAGDELYISVTEYPAQSKASHFQVPSFPTHWLSNYLDNVKDVELWKKTMSVCEPHEVIFSLVDEDLIPWNVDDLLGSVKLKVSCENGKMTTEWVVPNATITKADENKSGEYIFNGDGAEYRLLFSLENGNKK